MASFRIITGTMGSGKSYLGAELGVQCWREGGIVHSNLDFIPERIAEEGWEDLYVPLGDNPDEWIPKLRAGVEGRENLIVIDEGMLLFNCRDTMKNGKLHADLFSFFVYSRKKGFDVYLIAQSQGGTDKQFTRIALETIACVATKTLPLIGPYWHDLRGDFMRVWKFPNGRKQGRREFARFDHFIGGIYRTEATHGKFENMALDVRRKPKAQGTESRRAWAKAAGIVAALGCLLLVAKSLAAAALSGGAPPESPAPPALAEGAAVRLVDDPAPVSVAPVAPVVAEAPRFRVWGSVDRGRGIIWEAATGLQVGVGGVYDDALVEAISFKGVIVKVALDDGREISFRPATREDWRAAQKPNLQIP